MNGKKAKALRKASKNQVYKTVVKIITNEEVQTSEEFRNLVSRLSEEQLGNIEKLYSICMTPQYTEPKKHAKRFDVIKEGKPATVDLIFTDSTTLDFCFRSVYQGLKRRLKHEGKIKNAKATT